MENNVTEDNLIQLATEVVSDGEVDNKEILQLYDWCIHQRDRSSRADQLLTLIKQICEDGVVTSGERAILLKELKQISNQLDPIGKGDAFERYVITRFSCEEYQLIEWRSDKIIEDWGWPLSSQWPDLVMQHIGSGTTFAIECKYRTKAFGSTLKWARPKQVERYRAYGQDHSLPVYVAIGLGGCPACPDALYIVALPQLASHEVELAYLEQFRLPERFEGLEFE